MQAFQPPGQVMCERAREALLLVPSGALLGMEDRCSGVLVTHPPLTSSAKGPTLGLSVLRDWTEPARQGGWDAGWEGDPLSL